jgi:hypothetical protein
MTGVQLFTIITGILGISIAGLLGMLIRFTRHLTQQEDRLEQQMNLLDKHVQECKEVRLQEAATRRTIYEKLNAIETAQARLMGWLEAKLKNSGD